jgi:NAD(P)-dependent dehydrogenase (short-subunit alcohol dehydrogenase family)
MELGLANAAAVVVGGTRGMGFATSMCLADEGARIAIIGRPGPSLSRAADALTAAGSPTVLQLAADASSDADLNKAFAAVGAAWGEINVLINAVGPGGSGGIEDLDDAGWLRAQDLGVMAAVRSVRAALPLLRAAAWARIVNLTATSVQHQLPYLVAYTAAKSSLLSVTKNLARSLAPEGILVNAVAPGPILTDWVVHALDGTGVDITDPIEVFRWLHDAQGMSVDLGRLGLPEEVAAVITFCASQRNGFMTGAHLNVDGGTDFL